MRLHLAAVLAPAALWSGLALLAFASGPNRGPEPSPDLSPEDVVRIQVEALGHNDVPAPDAGIETAFRFASPSNRAATGPLERFARMIRGGYPDMIGFERAEYGPVSVRGDQAVQRVTLVQPDGRRATYAFVLSRQAGGPYDGCWMTDGVIEPPPPTNGLRRT